MTKTQTAKRFKSSSFWVEHLKSAGYFIENDMANEIARWWVADEPLLLEGPPGTGKTSFARKISESVGAPLYRMQCYDGMTSEKALYSFSKRLQDLEIEKAVDENRLPENLSDLVFSEKCMIRGKLAQSFLDRSDDVIVLVDELDKSAEGSLEAALLEFFDEGTITIEETNRVLSSVTGRKPHIIVTSNAGLDQSGLKSGGKATLSYPILRRCKYIHLAEPTVQRQWEIICSEVPELGKQVGLMCALFVKKMNKLYEMEKPIALSETICWARSLALMGAQNITVEIIKDTKGDLAKSEMDIKRLLSNSAQILTSVKTALADSNL